MPLSWTTNKLRKKSQGVLEKYLERNKNENTIYWNYWDVVKAVLRKKFMAVNACIKKEISHNIII